MHAPRATFASGGISSSSYMLGASWLSLLLLLYPISWALSEGGNVITPTSEMVFYGVLDICAGPALLFFFLWKLSAVDYSAFGFSSFKYTDTQANTAKV